MHAPPRLRRAFYLQTRGAINPFAQQLRSQDAPLPHLALELRSVNPVQLTRPRALASSPRKRRVQGYLTYKKTHPLRTLPKAYA